MTGGAEQSNAIRSFHVQIAATQVEDLRERLKRTRWPDPEPVSDWSQGVPTSWMQELTDYWLQKYDMQRVADRLNAWPNYLTNIDGVDVHFIHARSPHADATPLIMSHGWPGSIIELLDSIGPLTDPTGYGGRAEDAYHVIATSLPGFGYSGKPSETGWGIERIAGAWLELMGRLGYDRFYAHGGDWGAVVTVAMAAIAPQSVGGIHLNFVPAPLEPFSEITPQEIVDSQAIGRYFEVQNGYAVQQSTGPQTIAYALDDSPVGLCAWLADKFVSWSGYNGHPEKGERALDRDALLDSVMIYWLTASAGSSARIYWEASTAIKLNDLESYKAAFALMPKVAAPAACSIFPGEVLLLSERIVKDHYTDLRYYKRPERGGHLPALEVPDLFLQELQAGLRAIRGS